jgi:hypothetical protein
VGMISANGAPVDWRRLSCATVNATVVATVLASSTIGYGCARGAADPPSYPSLFMDHDGTYLVGTDIRPGLYLSQGASGAGNCSWTRLSSGGSGDVSNVVAQGDSRGAQYALIAPTDKAFETHGCQMWSIGTRPATPIEPPGRTCIYPLTGCQDPNLYAPSP